jgi:AcrR family transcriptional regulator
MTEPAPPEVQEWQRRVLDRALGKASARALDRGGDLIRAATELLERSNGDDFTVQDVADAATQSLRGLYVHFEGKDDLLLAVFEEQIRGYADRIRLAIDGVDDPFERLVAGLSFAIRFAELGPRGVTIGLARLRAKLIESAPDQLAAAYRPVSTLFAQLLRDAADAGHIQVSNLDGATSMVLALRQSVSLSSWVGNEYGLALPSDRELVEFLLRGLGARLPEGWEAPVAPPVHGAREAPV